MNPGFLRMLAGSRLALRLSRTSFARKLADVMHRAANRIESVNGQSPLPDPGQWTVPSMPSWVEDELRAVAHLEPELIPSGGSLAKYGFYSVPSDPAPGEAYFKLLAQCGATAYTHILLVPWLKQGGADRGIIYHAKAIAEYLPDARILVLATERADSPWANRLPANATYIEFGKIAGHLEFSKQVAVMVRLVVQLQVPVIHLINSRVGWEMIRCYGRAVRQRSRVYASLFCDDYDSNMLPVGYARDYLRDCFQEFETIFCDNSCYPRIWSLELGIPSDAFTVLPFPYDGDIDAVPQSAITREGAGRVLWAGRLDRQKRPDVLAKIAVRMPDIAFDVYGRAVMTGLGEDVIESLSSLPNVTMHGEFSRLEEVVTADHFAYLHTTSWEGTPTILFDVAASGLPICAPAVGGIVDFIDAADLVADPDDVDGFVRGLELLRESAECRDGAVSRQRMSLHEQRRWEHFCSRLSEIEMKTDAIA